MTKILRRHHILTLENGYYHIVRNYSCDDDSSQREKNWDFLSNKNRYSCKKWVSFWLKQEKFQIKLTDLINDSKAAKIVKNVK